MSKKEEVLQRFNEFQDVLRRTVGKRLLQARSDLRTGHQQFGVVDNL